MAKVNVPAEIGQQIQLARIKKNWSQTDLANQLGWGTAGQTLVSRLERGTTRTDEDKLTTILELLEIRQDATDSLQEDKQEVSGIPSDYREIPVYNVRVSAGHGELPGVEAIKQLVQMPRMFLPSNGQIGIVRVEGDSMFPTISHGDHVAVEFGSGYTSDGLYLIRIDDSVFVKRLQKEFGQVRIISDNTIYREMVVHPEDEQQFSLIGRVALILRVT